MSTPHFCGTRNYNIWQELTCNSVDNNIYSFMTLGRATTVTVKEGKVKRIYTKRAMEKTVLFHASARDVELLRLAASRQEISRADFIRQALRERATRVLAGADTNSTEEPSA